MLVQTMAVVFHNRSSTVATMPSTVAVMITAAEAVMVLVPSGPRGLVFSPGCCALFPRLLPVPIVKIVLRLVHKLRIWNFRALTQILASEGWNS